MRNLYIDFDGVIVDSITPLYKMCDEAGIDKKNVKEVSSFIKSIDYDELLNISHVINDSFNAIKKIVESNKFNVFILTHITSSDEGVKKTKFIRKYLSDVSIMLVPRALSKTSVINAKNSILVDDYAGNLREWETAGGIPVRFNLNLNSKGFKVIDNLLDLINLF